MEKKLIEIRHVDIFYGEAQVVWDVSFEVCEGTILALIGPNGAGKSTLLEMISGFVQPRKGDLQFAGRSIVGLSPEKIVEMGISQVPEGRRLFSQLTVAENLELGAFSKRGRANLRHHMEEAYELFPKLRERATQAAGSLSGGEQQMLAIARALMSSPRLLMLDEPSLGLAPLIVEEMFRIIKQLNERGVTILLVEQNVVQSLKIADYAYVLQVGEIVRQGLPDIFLNDTEFQNTYLGLSG